MSKREKIKELIWLTLSCLGGEKVYWSKLWKVLFFIESDYYADYQEKLTGVAYIKNKYGPTPDYKIAKEALDELVKEGYVQQSHSDSDTKAFRVTGDYPIKYFNDPDKEKTVQVTCEKFKRLTPRDIAILSHNDPVYLMAENLNDKLNFDFVKYRSADGYTDGEDFEVEPIKLSKRGQQKLAKILTVD